jgi:hypothetical protein
VKTLRYYIVPAFILAALFLADRCSAAEPLPEYAPITESCYYTSQHGAPTESCVANREEAEDYLAKRHWSCAAVLYVIWQGSTESVRCRGFDGGVIDYISGTDGNLHTR